MGAQGVGSALGVWDVWIRVSGTGRVQGVVWGSGSWVLGLGIGVWIPGFVV